jgi:hypothetical protein
MGERAGYRVRANNKVSPILRKHWYLGDSKPDIKKIVINTCANLMSEYHIELINSGSSALRHDLDFGRLTLAFFNAVYSRPFDSLNEDENCDISDHGLYELEMKEWNRWEFKNYEIDDCCKELRISKPITICEILIEKDKLIKEGIHFHWNEELFQNKEEQE